MKITDTYMAKELDMHQQSLSRMKTTRTNIYDAIRGYFELRVENEELKAKLAKYEKIENILNEDK